MELLRKKLKDDYGVEWRKGYIFKLFSNHFYYGIMTWKNKTYQHHYPPIITKALFDEVQAVREGFDNIL